MATATLKKPAAKPAAKPALAKGAPAKPALAKAAPKGAAAAKKPAPVKAEKPKAAPKPVKPFESGEVVEFKGYAGEAPEGALFNPGDKLAVVGQREDNGQTFVAVVKEDQYHAYVADPENSGVDGEEVSPSEIKRTGKQVEQPYHLPVVGQMSKLLKDNEDTLELAQKLYSTANESFFYLGGALARLWKEKGEDGKPLFTQYGEYSGDSDSFDAFVRENFGEDFGGVRKAKYYISIYENFASLPNAAEVVKELAKVGWYKAALMVNFVTEQNAMELIETAQAQSVKEFDATLKTQYTTEGTTSKGTASTARVTIKRTTFGFKLFEDQGEGVRFIIEQARKQLGLSDDNQVFETIVTQWAADHLGEAAEKAKAKVNTATRKLVKSGVKLPADHPAAAQAA